MYPVEVKLLDKLSDSKSDSAIELLSVSKASFIQDVNEKESTSKTNNFVFNKFLFVFFIPKAYHRENF